MKILIADDIDINLYMLNSLLTGHGHSVVEASNGAEALKILHSETIELIISDILMPVMDGFALCIEVKKDDQLKNIPFIFYTATYTGVKDEEFALKIGADLYIMKPCEPDLFMLKINEIITKDKHHINLIEGVEKEDAEGILKLYNDRLIKKLEQKMIQAEKEVIARRETEIALKRSEDLLNATQKICKIGGWEWDTGKQEMYWTLETYAIHDIEAKNFEAGNGNYLQRTLGCINDKDRERVKLAFDKCVIEGIPFEMECKFRTEKGRELYIRVSGIPIIESGIVIKIHGFIEDFTEKKLAQIEKDELQTQLLQVQKLDSLGQLAGGISHDFNNILSVILGYCEILLQNTPLDIDVYNQIHEIFKAGKRASDLTKQLLIFSRKNVLQPVIADINDLITDIENMLRRLIGDHIIIKTNLQKPIGKIKADPGQIQQVIMNIVINARDAMPNGGEIFIETSQISTQPEFLALHKNIKPGDYILLTLSDNGTGMSETVLSRLFEPFFTTKEQGKGTGLGLATVYGIVNQSGGSIWVDSELGKGSQFNILIPVTKGEVSYQRTLIDEEDCMGNQELIVVVEDEDPLRKLLENMIQRLGYRVISFNNGLSAYNEIENKEIMPDLILTDIILPGISGKELYKKLNLLNPSLKVLFMSGYTDQTVIDNDVFFPQGPFIVKPFSIKTLSQRIKYILSL